ncbi:DNA polymerase Y family protein [Pseudomonas sp. RIT-PI-S]|uniref:Y-family DNA polymerase n=1 Tax=Pseudomonas sp. RIT-PI-S TaxID=3035295 RepID=UPI0021D97D36|nr:DNA polymerase Y family protein [Pseudomonas sp. RIT-PI-S]
MLWACILLPQLAMDVARRRQPDPDAPLALVTGPAQRRQLRAVNPAARALGLRPGQSLSAAHALSRDFITLEYDLAQAEQAQQLLAAWAYGFSSQVSLHYPRAVLLEVASGMGLFGPWPAFEARLRHELTALGFAHRIVLATNPVAARMLANVHDGLAITTPAQLHSVLAKMPVDRIGLAKEQATALMRMGLRQVGQLLQLERAALARRFSPPLLAQLDLLQGARAQALTFFNPPERFDSRIELNFDVESTQALLFPLRRLINDLGVFLTGRDGGVQRFVIHLEHAEGADTQVPIGLLAAERDPSLLFELARGRLEPVQVTRPVRNVRLLAAELPAYVPVAQGLFEARAAAGQGWEQLRERLRARLGDDAVGNLRYQADHRPERAWAVDDYLAPRQPGGTPLLRPGWLLPEAQPLPTAGWQWLAGPERIESGWWDGGDVRRDYFRLGLPSGRQAWVYRTVGEDHWWLQGWFG